MCHPSTGGWSINTMSLWRSETLVDFRINWTLQIGEGKIRVMTPVGAVCNRTASAQLETLLAIPIYRGAPTKHGVRKNSP